MPETRVQCLSIFEYLDPLEVFVCKDCGQSHDYLRLCRIEANGGQSWYYQCPVSGKSVFVDPESLTYVRDVMSSTTDSE